MKTYDLCYLVGDGEKSTVGLTFPVRSGTDLEVKVGWGGKHWLQVVPISHCTIVNERSQPNGIQFQVVIKSYVIVLMAHLKKSL
jgi:hypothetical protein